jgi:long-chain acyl-CoA synthetase
MTPDRLTVGGVLDQHGRSRADHRALVCGAVSYSYAEFGERVARLAAALRGAGVEPGSRVLWIGQNCHRVLECLVAAGKLGAVFCPANWRQSSAELAFIIDDLGPAVVVWQQEDTGEVISGARSASEAAERAVWIRHDADDDDPAGYEHFLRSGSGEGMSGPVDGANPVLLMYTAAFSGRPNGAMFSHIALTTQAVLMAWLHDVDSDYVYLNCGPLHHMATLVTTLSTFQMGGTNVFTRRAEPEELCRLIATEQCTGAFLMGPTMDQMIELNHDGRFDLKSLRTYPGHPTWSSAITELPAWTSMVTVDQSRWTQNPAGYGQTEVMGMLTFTCLGGSSQGTHGRPSPFAEVAVLDPDGVQVSAGDIGEICARGPTVTSGYWNRDDLNTERRKGGWYHTNDLARYESDGSLSFIGPRARIIKSAAECIYPAEVEGAIRKHPAVRDVAVIGVPDPVWVQNVKAIVVLEDGAHVTTEDIINEAQNHIASYKKPKSVEFSTSIPRQGGAIDYDAIDAQFGGGGYPGQ